MNKELMKKACAEFLGTFVLVFVACGTAIITFGTAGADVNVVATALAFGLVIVAMAFSIGGISGCHINPAVSLGVLLCKKMSVKDFLVYILAQILGATVGAAVLYGILKGIKPDFAIWATNGISAGDEAGAVLTAGHYIGGLAIEMILTFIFVYVILAVTSKTENGKTAGFIIGLTLTLVHLIGIGFTGTSVNPARSIGPALMAAAFGGGTEALSQIWIFIVAPLLGAVLAALTFKCLHKPAAPETAEIQEKPVAVKK